MKKKNLTLGLMFVSFVFLTVNCQAQNSQSPFIGKWLWVDGVEHLMIEFTKDNKVLDLDSSISRGGSISIGTPTEVGSYTIQGKKLIATIDGEGVFFELLDQNSLMMLEEELIFKRYGDSQTSTSTSKDSIIGTYTSSGNSLIERIEFEKDGTCYTVDSIMGLKQAMQYKVNGDKIVLTAGGATQPCFRIVDSKTIEGITTGFYGTYRKK